MTSQRANDPSGVAQLRAAGLGVGDGNGGAASPEAFELLATRANRA